MPVGGCRHSQVGAGDPSTSSSPFPAPEKHREIFYNIVVPDSGWPLAAVSRTTGWYDGFRYSLFGRLMRVPVGQRSLVTFVGGNRGELRVEPTDVTRGRVWARSRDHRSRSRAAAIRRRFRSRGDRSAARFRTMV